MPQDPGLIPRQALLPTMSPAVFWLQNKALPISVGNPTVSNKNLAEVSVWGSVLSRLLDINPSARLEIFYMLTPEDQGGGSWLELENYVRGLSLP